jgi:hypothetical protein
LAVILDGRVGKGLVQRHRGKDTRIEAGMAAMRWLVHGYGYDITGADVWAAYSYTMKAAENVGRRAETHGRIRALVQKEAQPDRFVTKVIGRELGL